MTETNLLYYLGKSPELKVLDFLIENERNEWSIAELVENGMSRPTVKKALEKLLKLNMVAESLLNKGYYTIHNEHIAIIALKKLSAEIDRCEE